MHCLQYSAIILHTYFLYSKLIQTYMVLLPLQYYAAAFMTIFEICCLETLETYPFNKPILSKLSLYGYTTNNHIVIF